MRKTKIIATLGPATETPEMLRELIRAGVNIFRLNMSHAKPEKVREIIPLIRQTAHEESREVGILMDTQGPAIRTGDLPTKLNLKPGDEFTFTVLGEECTEEYCVNVNYEGLVKDLQVGDEVIVDNGVLRMEVLAKSDNHIRCRVLTEGVMGSRRHINLPGVRVNLPALTEKDIEDVRLGCETDVDYIALSFCREAADVRELRRLCQKFGKSPRLVAKIEDQEAVRNLHDIVAVADAIMVARGDLGIECLLEDLPIIQRKIVKTCLRNFKPVIVATHMLESMIENPYPTRAEITDVANAVFEQVDAVMLSGETTTGKYPKDCVLILDRIARRTERSGGADYLSSMELETSTEKHVRAAVHLADQVRAAAIVLFTRTGYMAAVASALRPRWSPVYAFTESPQISRKLTLNRSIYPFMLSFADDPEQNILRAEKILLEKDFLMPGNTIVVVTEFQSSKILEAASAKRNVNSVELRVVE
ncbi:pyruvate kinase [Oscillatoria laete-virens NRMC-F 0139]|nr:pyruvate kinase [Oscillatoria laete-virens NRMC-F 0139]